MAVGQPRMLFFSLQGLGNSIINLPVFFNLREKFRTTVICFNNGSSSLFRSFHDDVIGVDSRRELIRRAWQTKAEFAYICYPTWKKEAASILANRSETKYFLRDESWLNRVLFAETGLARPGIHHLENNIRLARSLMNVGLSLNLREFLELAEPRTQDKVLGLHPTASSIVKYYPLSFWIRMVNELGPDYDQVRVYCGRGQQEISFCNEILAGVSQVARGRIKIFANLGFGELARSLSELAQFIGSDSSLMHFAALMDRRTLGLWSFADFRVIYPYGNQASVYVPKETISARDHEYPNTVPEYMKRASADDVVAIIQRQRQPDFEILPDYKEAVKFYEY